VKKQKKTSKKAANKKIKIADLKPRKDLKGGVLEFQKLK